MHQPIDVDIAIVGGGMVGLALALRLSSAGTHRALKIAVIEAAPAPENYAADRFDPRVVALSQQSIQLLSDLAAWPQILAGRTCGYRAMDVWDAEGTGNIQFNARDIHADTLGHIVENSLIVSSLRAQLARAQGICLLESTRVVDFIAPADSADRPRLRVDSDGLQTTVNAALVVAADGAHSGLRERAGFATREWSYDHTAIVTTVTTSDPHRATCWQRFTRQGPIALLPLQRDTAQASAESHFCSLVWSAETALAQQLMAADDDEFCAALGRACEYRLGEITWADRRFALPLRQRHATRYFQPGIVLVGDAAHTIHPLAGQGVNLGFYDVNALAVEILRAAERDIPFSDPSILRRYERARQAHNLAAMASMEGFKRLFGADNLPVRWLRNQGMRLVNHQFLVKKQLARIAAGQFSG